MRTVVLSKIYGLLSTLDKYIDSEHSDARWAAAIYDKVAEALDIAKLDKLPDANPANSGRS